MNPRNERVIVVINFQFASWNPIKIQLKSHKENHKNTMIYTENQGKQKKI